MKISIRSCDAHKSLIPYHTYLHSCFFSPPPPSCMLMQIDLAREASNLQRFNYNFRRTDRVIFPTPLYPLVSADVLVRVTVGMWIYAQCVI